MTALARASLARPTRGAVFDPTSDIVQQPRTRAVGNPGGGDHQASKRGVIGEGEHAPLLPQRYHKRPAHPRTQASPSPRQSTSHCPWMIFGGRARTRTGTPESRAADFKSAV